MESEKIIKNIVISTYGASLIAIVTYGDNSQETILGRNVEEINRKVDTLKSQQHKNFAELFKERILIFEPEKQVYIKNNYSIDGEGHFTKINSDSKKNNKPAKKVVTPKKEDETTSSKEESLIVREEPDGAIDVTNTSSDSHVRNRRSDKYKEKENKTKSTGKGIKNLKRIGAVALAAVLIGGAGYAGYKLAGGANDAMNNKYSNTNGKQVVTAELNNDGYLPGDPRFEQNLTGAPASFNYDSNTYESLGSNIFDDSMEEQLDFINEVCFYNISDIYNFMNGNNLSGSIEPCNVHNFVIEADRPALREIVNLRNMVVQNAYNSRNTTLTRNDIMNFLNQYVNYVFESGNSFNGKTIKSYDTLRPYSQYIVSVIGQSMLQLCPDYSYSTAYNNYNFDNLIDTFAGMNNMTYSYLMQNSGMKK